MEYYGAADNQMKNLRCGMPINLYLKSPHMVVSFILVDLTYQMRKIRRYTEWQSMPYKEKSRYDEFQLIKKCLHRNSQDIMIRSLP